MVMSNKIKVNENRTESKPKKKWKKKMRLVDQSNIGNEWEESKT